ncbi:MAG: hypothetical protein QOD31_3612, partial [Pseudonocardiales bacterium]|nr:hypothetical protein [Pseudonocardiales bacterium]
AEDAQQQAEQAPELTLIDTDTVQDEEQADD